jgi:Holliday junction resolvase-like predicted endonuclease
LRSAATRQVREAGHTAAMGSDRPRTAAQRAGDAAETLVAERLRGTGWTILGRNLRLGRNEIDLVAVDPGPPATLVVVEVRWRGRRDFGLPEETLDWRKRARLRAALGRLLDTGTVPDGTPLPDAPVRVDLVVVEPSRTVGGVPRVRHHRDALGG